MIREDRLADAQGCAGGFSPTQSTKNTNTEKSVLVFLAEKVGFEPTSPVRGCRISSAGRYDHFDTSPYSILQEHPIVWGRLLIVNRMT